MKKLALHNWREPDVPKCFPGLTEDKWVPAVMELQLITAVPEDIVRLFEIARGSILYGWFFYPLLTLAEEQLYRVQEAAVRARCKQAGITTTKPKKSGGTAPRDFFDLIDALAKVGIIPGDAVELWHNARKLRNHASHPERPTIMPPGMALSGINAAAARINQLFASNPDYFSILGQRVQKATGLGDPNRKFPVVVGIDVADERGFHLVALHGTSILGSLATTDPAAATRWCKDHGAVYVGADAPCAWRTEQGPRAAERLLQQMRYSLYQTPTHEAALTNPRFGWMLNGERLYQALRSEYPLLASIQDTPPFCFETYPFAASCAYAGRRLHRDDKKRDRRQILRAAGIDESGLTNIDFVDAGICALMAISVSIGYCTAIGEGADGFIVTPPLP